MGSCIAARPKQLPPQTHQNTIKILCLGVGGCGKTTFVKALKIINNVPWKEAEIQAFSKAIRCNYVKGMQDATEGARKIGLAVKPENEQFAKDTLTMRGSSEMNEENYPALLALWQDPAIQNVVEKHSELLTITHLSYFWEQVERVMSPSFIPNDEDILRARVRTAGANSSTIYIDKRYYEFFDVGGQRPERSKWEFVFKENRFNAIIYFVAVDEFDVENEDKDNDRTKLEISRFIFSELVNSDIIDEAVPVVLFLNRSDLFASRMADEQGFSAFKLTFPDYTGGQDNTKGMEYVRDYFLAVTERRPNIKTHFTCALNRNSLVIVWRTVKESLMLLTFKDLGL